MLLQKRFLFQTNLRNDTDELEERVQILELEMDNVENNIEILENQDSIHEVRTTDIEEDILNNQMNIEGESHSPIILT